jgi:UDPglucose 6-dehydrogenase
LAESLRVGVVGTGYVGLVTEACLAYLGHRVTCVDRDEDRISGLGLGRMPVYEPGLEEMVSRGVARERLDFAGGEGLAGLVAEADVLFVSVDTPQGENGAAVASPTEASGVASKPRALVTGGAGFLGSHLCE